MTVQDSLVFYVNGTKVIESDPNPEWTLLFYLRNKLRLCGTKEACGEGGCGACTVMLSRYDHVTELVSNLAVNACLTQLCSVHGTAIITVEGLGSIQTGLHAIQERIAKSHGTQCGFCTPGFVMSTYALLRNNPTPSEKDLEEALMGNLCRCTGYRPILEGLKTLCGAENCCQGKGGCGKGQMEIPQGASSLYDPSTFKQFHPSQEFTFPPELKMDQTLTSRSLRFESKRITWHRLTTLQDILRLKKNNPKAMLISGGAASCFKKTILESSEHLTLIEIPREISELTRIDESLDGLSIGSSVTFTQLHCFCERKLQDVNANALYTQLSRMISSLGNPQLRNTGTIGGGLVCENPISDWVPFLVAAKTIITLSTQDEGLRRFQLPAHQIKDKGGLRLVSDEVLVSIRIPFVSKNQTLWFEKNPMLHAQVSNATILVTYKTEGGTEVESLDIVTGGSAGQRLVHIKDVHILSGIKNFTKAESGRVAMQVLGALPSSSSETESFLKLALKKSVKTSEERILLKRSNAKSSSQLFQIVPESQTVHDLIGRPTIHLSGLKHSTGEAVYIDDITPSADELYGAFVLSSEAKATIVSIDPSEALSIDGVQGYFDSSTLSESQNNFGLEHQDEQIFRRGTVTGHGQPIGFIVAKDPLTARRAAKLVKVEYQTDPAHPPVLTIQEAIAKELYYGEERINRGNAQEAYDASPIKVQGQAEIHGQKHFYLEPTGGRAIPMEDGGVEVTLTSQSLAYAQETVAKAIGVGSHKVIVQNQRIGGSFGGRESRPNNVAAAVAIAATRLQKPVRCILPRDDDSEMTGNRHPMIAAYKVGTSPDGSINSIILELYSNGGFTVDLSPFVMQYCCRCLVSSYNIPNWQVLGRPCKTNVASAGAFRGFGSPQASFFIETIMENVAHTLRMSPIKLRQMHFYKEKETTPFGYPMENCTVQRCWEECIENSNYASRLDEIQEFNRLNKWKKRGISLNPLSFILGFPVPFMNQGAALVLIFKDGTVTINHGGIEMGQGLNTKMAQIASKVLDVPMEKIIIASTNTDKVPNTIVTAGSNGTDLFGPAVKNACEELAKRLEPLRAARPDATWEQLTFMAYFSRVNLSAVGFNCNDFNHGTNYFVYGAGCSEVELNCMTGEYVLRRTDIVMDIGESINPAIDFGQLEGAFMQGVGLFALEQFQFSPDGKTLSKGPLSYKIPTVASIPENFNVSFLRGSSNPKSVYSSKGLGEPCLVLGHTVFFALQNAIKDHRTDLGLSPDITLNAPLLPDQIRQVCGLN